MIRNTDPLCNTFSIAAYDPESNSWGIAVASKYLAVGSIVPHAKSGIGVIATQSYTNVSFGPEGLKLLQSGKSAKEVLETLLAADDKPEYRQVGIVDGKGYSVSYTGEKCPVWAGSLIGTGYAIQGNTLAGENVLLQMEKVFLNSKDVDFALRLYAGLAAGEEAGGDHRGKQAASLLVVKEKAGFGGVNDRMIDLRIDDHKEPVKELGRLLKLHYANGNPGEYHRRKKYSLVLHKLQSAYRKLRVKQY